MANYYIPDKADRDLLQLIYVHSLTENKSNSPTEKHPAFIQLSATPSVQAGIGQLLAASDSKNIQADYLRLKAFLLLVEVLMSKNFQQESALADMYVGYIKNLLEAEPIRTGEQPQSDCLLETLYRDKTVENKIKGMIKNTQLLSVEDIIGEGIQRLFDKVSAGKFNGKSTLKTYFTSICMHLVYDALKAKPIENKIAQENLDLIEIDANDLKDTADILGNDFTIGIEENKAAKTTFKKYFDDVFNNKIITESCREFLRLKYQEDYSNAQIAAIMQKAEQTIKNKKSICDDQFKKAMDTIPELRNFLKENFGKY